MASSEGLRRSPLDRKKRLTQGLSALLSNCVAASPDRAIDLNFLPNAIVLFIHIAIDNVPGMLLHEGSIEFEIFKDLFLKQVTNFGKDVDGKFKEPALHLKNGKIIKNV